MIVNKGLKINLIVKFGSQVTGKTREKSDIDIAVLANRELTLAERSDFISEIAKKFSFSEDSIDLVEIEKCSPLMQFKISQEGQLLNGSLEDFIKFKILAWKRYLDTAKLRRLREKMLDTMYAQ